MTPSYVVNSITTTPMTLKFETKKGVSGFALQTYLRKWLPYSYCIARMMFICAALRAGSGLASSAYGQKTSSREAMALSDTVVVVDNTP
jgi:hypothetical protein